MYSIQKRVNEYFLPPTLILLPFFQLHCCGIDQYQDWFNADIWTGQPYVPDSCCIEEKSGCGKQITANETYGLIHLDVCSKRALKE